MASQWTTCPTENMSSVGAAVGANCSMVPASCVQCWAPALSNNAVAANYYEGVSPAYNNTIFFPNPHGLGARTPLVDLPNVNLPDEMPGGRPEGVNHATLPHNVIQSVPENR